MRIVICGMGVQGEKRKKIIGNNCIATVDPINNAATYKIIQDIPISSYDAVFVCTPEEPKYNIISYALSNKKHVLVEKPLHLFNYDDFNKLEYLANTKKVVLYTAYNHRFEPHIVNMQRLIASESLGNLYHCRLFYGNGTARDARNSVWRDSGSGVLGDLGSHILNTIHFLFGDEVLKRNFSILGKNTFENSSSDHVIFANLNASFSIEAEMTLLSWRNHFSCDIFAEKGSAHIKSLCKWGPSKFTHRKRILPSGRPLEISETLIQKDPTWAVEYEYFKTLCSSKTKNQDIVHLNVDKWIHKELTRMEKEDSLV